MRAEGVYSRLPLPNPSSAGSGCAWPSHAAQAGQVALGGKAQPAFDVGHVADRHVP